MRRLVRAGSVAALLLAGAPFRAHARPTHGEIEPLAADVELDGHELFPLEVGRTWTYRAGGTNRVYRHVIEPAAGAIAKAGRKVSHGVELAVYEVAKDGTAKEIEREALDSTDQGALLVATSKASAPGVTALDPPSLEMPWKVTASAWPSGSPYKPAGLADVDTAAGSWQRCLVVDGVAGAGASAGSRLPLRRFFCANAGLVLVLASDVEGRWHTALELEQVGRAPASP